jgi:K+-sensing histidine kinase KdpD
MFTEGESTASDPAQMHKYLKLILNQTMLMQTFVDDLLDLKQLKEGVFSLSCKVFDPNEVFQSVCSIFSPQSDSKKVKLNFFVHPGLRLPN